MEIKQVAVIGAGTMGNGIAQVFAQAGYPVTMIDIAAEQLQRGQATIERSLAKLVEKGKLGAAERDAALARIHTAATLDAAAGADLAVEAVFENAAVKKETLHALDAILPPQAILASNTSSISITELAAATGRPAQVIGMHFMNPVPLMQLVEIIRGLQTGDDTATATVETVRRLGKTPVLVNDAAGFVANRILMPMINEAVYTLMEGVASAEAIDTVMKLGMNHPMGPLTLADLIGLDVCLAIMEVLHKNLGDDKYRPCPLLRRMVAAGYLGRKSGRGFYTY
ncbi:MAG TPA: 3-hydroxybutyryl-CoA dehydrogenase [Anaerolineae bacterium]|nr:3-hydroxybutyryl-CoA dehydrogenase [Anaerolineae bacterium]HOR00856.1 3-hydroxybutyryl-CoA dehydrogenase [Anaerolineae bacterium]HPL26897.1 3-hydroxybutyryl-CoA dehydrogenase [Anaerolineae bacterium]HPL26898.1 3-hydroxybutyryl-CoA dehydrogenase [Anaerolineae bacterium]